MINWCEMGLSFINRGSDVPFWFLWGFFPVQLSFFIGLACWNISFVTDSITSPVRNRFLFFWIHGNAILTSRQTSLTSWGRSFRFADIGLADASWRAGFSENACTTPLRIQPKLLSCMTIRHEHLLTYCCSEEDPRISMKEKKKRRQIIVSFTFTSNMQT